MAILRSRALTVSVLGLGLATIAALTGCSTDTGGGSGGGGESGVAWGASKEEYQAALADMEPVELVMQTGTASVDHPDNLSLIKMVEFIEEYSGGKITIDVTYAYGLNSNVLDFDDMLLDGRVDLSSFWPQYDPAEYPATNLLLDTTVLRDPRMYVGFFSAMAAWQEVGLQTPEIMEEWQKKGITPLNVMSPDGPTIIVCNKPVNSLEDLKGRQIRSGGTVHSREIQELGAIPVSLPYPEVYEALQRGVLDCSMSAHSIATSGGHIEVAPYVYHTDSEAFASTPTNFYAGPRFLQLPKAAQQLIQEGVTYLSAYAFDRFYERVTQETHPTVVEGGGGFFAMPEEVDEKLKEINEGILADVEASSVLDGKSLVERSRAAVDKWVEKVIELGYEDAGPFSAFPEWYTETPDHEPWRQAVVEEILAKYSPVNNL